MIKLTVLTGPDTGNVFIQHSSPIVLGRNNDCDVVLHDGAVSRRHCIIEACGDVFVVSDLRSPNGLFLNDPKNRIDSQVLRNGDELIFGRSRIRIELPVLLVSEPTGGEAGDVSFMELQSPALTIEDALMADSSSVSLPSSWQEGMTVCTPRSKLIAALDQSTERAGIQSAFAKKSPKPAKDKSRFFTDMLMGVKKFFSSLRFSW
jgi:predicted component of type VI protein secretion system